MGRAATGGLAACLWLWTASGALAADSTPYQQALECFNHGDDARALSLLEKSPAPGDAHERADALNLRGAIHLREHRADEARGEFEEAARLDPGLWAARFNAAEVSFRAGRYAQSREQFQALAEHTGRLFHPDERQLVDYKLRLAELLDGNEKSAADFVAAHRADRKPPLAWYYLNAALEYQHGHAARGNAALQEAAAVSPSPSEQVFAESFAELRWPAHNPDHVPAAPFAESTVVPHRAVAMAAPKTSAATLDVVELIPGKSSSAASLPTYREAAHHDGPHTAAHLDPVANPGQSPAQMPPSQAGLNPPSTDTPPARAGSPVADVLAKRKSHASPSPSASPAGSPGDNETPSSSALPEADAASPTPGPAGTPSPAYVQKYEAAMVKFLEKDYAEAKRLLDEANAIQPNQPNTANLRNQIFKQYYEGAYSAYQHADYPAALTQLDGADGVGTNTQNQSDAFNLRGLVLSKQRNYPEAETMFQKAIKADPGLWAAKFNYAEVPFNYKNFTVARSRFEELFSQTDATKQPVEAELAQFKVFLTLLLEGKEDAARTFMDHFNFSGATPARYFCQAALNFYTGEADKAQGWIDSARKEYPARKSSSFLEAFYRVGWLVDPNAPAVGAPGTAVAVATPPVAPSSSSPAFNPTPIPPFAAVTPSPRPAGTPALAQASAAPTVAPGTPKPAASASAAGSPPLVAAATPTVMPAFRAMVTPPGMPSASPIILAAASPTPRATATAAPSATVAAKVAMAATASPMPTASPRVAAATPAPTASPIIAAASPAPTALPKAAATSPIPTASPIIGATSPTPTASPKIAAASATPTASPKLAAASPVPSASPKVASTSPTPSASPKIAVASPVLTASPKLAAASPAVARTPAPTASPTPAPAETTVAAAEPASPGGDFARVFLVGLVLVYFLYVVGRIAWSAVSRKPRRAATRMPSLGSRKGAESDHVELPR